jgi:pyruvate dehydrogenase E2 component (dihydrolipoamide acetyltransferase)
MSKTLKLPSFGADMDDAVFVQWNVKPGDKVTRSQIAAVVETQKGAIDVELWDEGIVARLIAAPGERLPVGAPLALIAEEGEDWQALAAEAAAAAQVSSPEETKAAGTAMAAIPSTTTSAAADASRARISPAARKRAAELGVDIAALATKLGGKAVSLADVEAAAGSTPAAPASPAPATSPAEAMRAAIAAAMSKSKREIPHYYLSSEIEVEAASTWLERFNAERPVTERVLFAALGLRAIALALREFPALNGRWLDGRFEPAAQINLGVVTSLRSGGLVVPTVHEADKLALPELMKSLNEALTRARKGQLRSSDLADSTITVSNLGDLGCDSVLGVIYPPQVALVGLGSVSQRPWVRDGQLVVARTLTASLAADHRASDGMLGARFLAALRARLARPEELL